jgi:hypothetical protein
MPAIARNVAHALVRAVFALMRTLSWKRRAFATIILATVLLADTHTDIIDVFGSMAAALSDHNVSEFMNNFDKDMPAYDTLKIQVAALMTGTDISSSAEPVQDQGDEVKRTAELDWYLQIRSQAPNGPIVTRRQVIHCELRKQGKHWKIVSLQPMDFFSPPTLDK